jgi:hypothetical protein
MNNDASPKLKLHMSGCRTRELSTPVENLEIGPGRLAKIWLPINHYPLPTGQRFVPSALWFSSNTAFNLDLMSVKCGEELLLNKLLPNVFSALSAGPTLDLKIVDPPEGSVVTVLFKNPSDHVVTLGFCLLGYASRPVKVPASSPTEEVPTSFPAEEVPARYPESLLRKCQRWFSEGLLAALEGRGCRVSGGAELSDADLANLVREENERPLELEAPRLLTTLRRFAAQAANVMAIPLQMAIQGWEDLQNDNKHIERKIISIGVGPETLALGECRSIEVAPLATFRPLSLRIDPSNAHRFKICDFKIGKNSQFATVGTILGCFGGERDGLPLGIDTAGPGQPITIVVENPSSNSQPEVFTAVLIGEVVS